MNLLLRSLLLQLLHLKHLLYPDSKKAQRYWRIDPSTHQDNGGSALGKELARKLPWYQRFEEIMDGWTNLSKISI